MPQYQPILMPYVNLATVQNLDDINVQNLDDTDVQDIDVINQERDDIN